MKFRILSAILRSPWAIDEQFAIAHGGVIAGLLNGMEIDESFVDAEEAANSIPYALSMTNGNSRKYSTYDDAPKGSIAVIPVRGALMKDDQECGPVGMDTLGARLMEADKHPNIASSILYIDSPGGTVDGTQAFADKVKATTKPVVAFVDGMMCSAAFWIGSSADHVIAQNSTTEIGSIGVMMSFADMQPMWEAKGVKFHRINADQSTDKNKEFTDALKGDYKAIKSETLNPLADQFINAVKSNRPGITNDSVFTAKVYFAEDALKLGLIDEIGNFEAAVNKASQLSDERNLSKANSQPTKSTLQMKQLTLLTALLAVGAIEITDGGAFLNVEQLEAIEDKLNADASALQAANQATEAVDTLNDRITSLEADLAEALKTPGAVTATTKVENDNLDTKEDINAKLENMTMAERIEFLSK